MNGLAKALVVLASSLSLGSCLSFKVKAPLPSDNRLETIELCRDVKDEKDSLVPSDPGVEFTARDRTICCFLKVLSDAEEIQLRWKWYSQDKRLWKDSGPITVKKEKGGLATIMAYDFIGLGDKDVPAGEWTVAVFVNEILVGRKKFRILQTSPSREFLSAQGALDALQRFLDRSPGTGQVHPDKAP